MNASITVEAIEFCCKIDKIKNISESIYYFLIKGYKIIGSHPLLSNMVAAGFANYEDDSYTKNWQTKYWNRAHISPTQIIFMCGV